MPAQLTEIRVSGNKIITWFLGIIATCSIAAILFLLKLIYQIPLIQQNQGQMEKKIDVMQGSINGLSDRFSILSGEQIRQGERLNSIRKEN